MIVVCHRCGMDLSPTNCARCLGPCQYFECKRCKGHYCHECLATHMRENWCEEKRKTLGS